MSKVIYVCILLLSSNFSFCKIEQNFDIWDPREYISEVAKKVMIAAQNRAIRQRIDQRLENMRKYPKYYPQCLMLSGILIGLSIRKLHSTYDEIKNESKFKNAGYNKPILLVKRMVPFLNNKKSWHF